MVILKCADVSSGCGQLIENARSLQTDKADVKWKQCEAKTDEKKVAVCLRDNKSFMERMCCCRNTSSELEIFYAVASQIKLLLNTPEQVKCCNMLHKYTWICDIWQIWSALEDSKFSMAACLFLRAEAAHSALRTETRFLLLVQTRFPVILRQWATIAHFRNTILQVRHNRFTLTRYF